MCFFCEIPSTLHQHKNIIVRFQFVVFDELSISAVSIFRSFLKESEAFQLFVFTLIIMILHWILVTVGKVVITVKLLPWFQDVANDSQTAMCKNESRDIFNTDPRNFDHLRSGETRLFFIMVRFIVTDLKTKSYYKDVIKGQVA